MSQYNRILQMFQNTITNSLQIDATMALKYPTCCHSASKFQAFRREDEQFFAFIRNKKYKQAHVLGLELLSKGHKNKSIATFCQYISLNLLGEPEETQKAQQQQQQVSLYSVSTLSKSSEDEKAPVIEQMPTNSMANKIVIPKKIVQLKKELIKKPKRNFHIKNIKKETKIKAQDQPSVPQVYQSIKNILNIQFKSHKITKNQQTSKLPIIRSSSTGKENNHNFDNNFRSQKKAKKSHKNQFLQVKLDRKWPKSQQPLIRYHKTLKI